MALPGLGWLEKRAGPHHSRLEVIICVQLVAFLLQCLCLVQCLQFNELECPLSLT